MGVQQLEEQDVDREADGADDAESAEFLEEKAPRRPETESHGFSQWHADRLYRRPARNAVTRALVKDTVGSHRLPRGPTRSGWTPTAAGPAAPLSGGIGGGPT